MVSKEEQPYWYVTVCMDYAKQQYTVDAVREQRLAPDPLAPYVLIQAEDEIGAFNEASKSLHRLGFRLGA